MAKFESIFNTNEAVDASLNELFSKKVEVEPKPVVGDEDEDEAKPGSRRSKNGKKKFDTEKEQRTIFIGNLLQTCKKEEVSKVFKTYGKIECVRFRNIVPEDLTKTKKYAFITKQQHPNKKTINAYVRFESLEAAEKAVKEANGMEFNGLHIRVDSAIRPKVHDNKRSLFLGGLPFDISDEDVFSHFEKCGEIEYVRIIRDNKTGIGKGFGYVMFKTADSTDLGLKLNGSSLNERKIRVNRCVKKQKEKKGEVKNVKKERRELKAQKAMIDPGKERQGDMKSLKRKKDGGKNFTKNKKQKETTAETKKTPKTKTAEKPSKTGGKKFQAKNRKQFKKKHISTNKKTNEKLKF